MRRKLCFETEFTRLKWLSPPLECCAAAARQPDRNWARRPANPGVEARVKNPDRSSSLVR